MDAHDRELILRIALYDSERKVPLGLLTCKFQAIQQTLYNIASMLMKEESHVKPGPEDAPVCNLVFVKAQYGSPLEVVTEIAEYTPRSLHGGDLCAKALNLLFMALQALQKRNESLILELFPDTNQRIRILRSLLPLFPEKENYYDIVVQTSSGEVRLKADLRSYILELMHLLWDRVVFKNRLFTLHERIQLNEEFRDGLWVLEYKPLGILAYGQTRAEAHDAFRVEFASCWDQIADEKDENLTEDAQELKRELMRLVEGVKELS